MNRHDWHLFYLLSVFVFGCVLFLIGFFPVDFQIGNLPSSPERPTKLDGKSLSRPKRQVSNVVLMIVDAMRYDFVSKRQMPYASQHCKIQLKAAYPTVTMPRIKSLSSGTISNFIDVVLNLGDSSSQPLQDSILHQMYHRGDKIVFYGDKTWPNMYSKLFHRYKSTVDSLYIQDFFEDDKNITENLRLELKDLSSWDFLILHYLGLDHIGHMEGSDGAKIFLKLREMDEVIEQIDKALSQNIRKPKPQLFVTADHGMRVGGGHGGNTPEEVYVPLITTNRNCSRQDGTTLQYNQIDIVPTLAILLDVPIPSTSIGCIIVELLDDMLDKDKLYALYYNTKFLVDKAVAKFGLNKLVMNDYYSWYEIATEAHKNYLVNENTSSAYLFEQAKRNYIRSAKGVSQLLADTYTRFEFGVIVLGVTLTSLATILVMLTCMITTTISRRTLNPIKYYGGVFILAVFINIASYIFNILHTNSVFLACLTTVPIFVIILLVVELMKLLAKNRLHVSLDIPVSVAFGIIFQTFSLASSSFIEEEHQTWYYLGTTFLLSLMWRNVSRTRLKAITFSTSSMERDVLVFFNVLRPLRKAFIAMAITVFIRRLNQTGDKWIRVPDVADWFASSDKIYLSVFLAVSLLLLVIQLMNLNSPLQTVACIIACFSIYCYRGVMEAVVFFHNKHFNQFLVLPFYWTSVIYILVSSYFPVICLQNKIKGNTTGLCQLLGTNLTVFALISALLHKPHNVILVFAMDFTLRCGYNLCDNMRGTRRSLSSQIILVYKVALTVCISRMFYFYQGNSNSLATIDLNPGFIGQSHYNPIFAAIMITANTYFAEIFGFLHLLLTVFQKQNEISITREMNEFENNAIEKNNYNLVTAILAAIKLLTTSVYLILMIAFRHHLFIFTVFSPKVLYECFAITLFYVNFSMTNLYLSLLYKII